MARAAVPLMMVLLVPAFVVAQNDKKQDKKQLEKEQQARRAQYLAMAKIVDAAMAQAPAESGVKWATDFSLKAQENKTYVPFTISVDPAKLNAGPTVMYLRVVEKGATAPAPTGADKEKKDEKEAQATPVTMPPFEDLHTVQLKAGASGQPMSVSRAFAVPTGDYDVYVALAEQTGQPSKDKAAIGRTAVLKHTMTVPDYWGTELTTTPIMVAEKVEQLSAPLSQDQQLERPYVLGNMEIAPAPDNVLSKKEELSLLFLIYNVQVNEAGKPDVDVDYRFNQKTGDTEKFFNRTQPQQFNASTLPPQFDVRAGHQVVGGQTVPLASFPEGEYRLEIKINDKLANKSITRDVKFTVTP
ncbi:MAG: hypothetical protein ACM36C_02965 [Acidobacteriota bacterium]